MIMQRKCILYRLLIVGFIFVICGPLDHFKSLLALLVKFDSFWIVDINLLILQLLMLFQDYASLLHQSSPRLARSRPKFLAVELFVACGRLYILFHVL